jgi:hypothetical protein
MDIDKSAICKIMSEMFDGVDELGIYPTSIAYEQFELYIEGVRIEAIGWTYADACVALDNGDDPRLYKVPNILARAKVDLGQ